MAEWNNIFPLVWFSGTLGQPHEENPKLRNFILENFCSIQIPHLKFLEFLVELKASLTLH